MFPDGLGSSERVDDYSAGERLGSAADREGLYGLRWEEAENLLICGFSDFLSGERFTLPGHIRCSHFEILHGMELYVPAG